MSNLDRLWDIEKHYGNLELFVKELNVLEENKEMLRMENRYQALKQTYEDLVLKKKTLKTHLRKLDQEVQIHEEKFKIAENTLYSGSVTDLKQLNHLEKEKEHHFISIDKLEDDILESMGTSDSVDSEIDNISRDILMLDTELVKKRVEVDSLMSELNDKINNEKSIIEELENSCDENLLVAYHGIRSRKGSGIAEIKNDVCGGCHMRIPENLVEKAKQGKKIINCENCGRILYPLQE
ncbi:zinc ribbon domain-containing protein [Gudongella sp. DL1XJH-153]|uniref:zinc ribbon domain-containing protein n=1 Tax=Gudongella sp. DL1XJH-153 TaxID=3409804 RepID=UPI003BB4D211